MKAQAVALPYAGPKGKIYWEWTYCPDCGLKGAHYQDKRGRGGVRCG